MASYIHHSEIEGSMYPVGKSISSGHYKFYPPYLHMAIYSIRFPPYFSAYSSKLAKSRSPYPIDYILLVFKLTWIDTFFLDFWQTNDALKFKFREKQTTLRNFNLKSVRDFELNPIKWVLCYSFVLSVKNRSDFKTLIVAFWIYERGG